ncbi:sensor histidine kinase [Archangium sp.]|uniref:sensor histidine kinase n=1 Tax=Archangium sp. TaxID=1872627 RepID=UPI002ED8BAA6
MTIRAKVWLFAAMAVVLVCLMGAHLFVGARDSRVIRGQLMATQGQLDGLGRVRALAWPYLNELVQMRQVTGSTERVRLEMLERMEVELEALGASMGRERQWLPERTPAVERREHVELRTDLRRWVERAEARVSAIPRGSPVGSAVEWSLYTEFSQTVGRRIEEMRREEQAEMEVLHQRWDESERTAEQLALLVPALCLVLVLALAFAILVPLQRALRGLTGVAERIGRGDFDIRTAMAGHDELGTLARAFDRMAGELRTLLDERQRLVRAEAEASEREARRHQALLEGMVLARTAELGDANTRLQESLRQLQEAQEQLLFADRLASVGRLAAGVAHEINNPLAYILGNLRFAQGELRGLMGAPSEEDRQELLSALGEAHEGAERVRFIVQDLKMLSRPDDMALDAVSLDTVVRSAAKMAHHEVRDRARLVHECDGVPAVRANAARLGQVFLNLFINAAHAIDPGRVGENEIRVVARIAAPGQVLVEVRDTGSGISAEHLGRIFDPFFTTKPVGVGTGLGLSVCHRIITALGGEIRVESEEGRGTAFFITLPVAEDAGTSEQSVA